MKRRQFLVSSGTLALAAMPACGGSSTGGTSSPDEGGGSPGAGGETGSPAGSGGKAAGGRPGAGGEPGGAGETATGGTPAEAGAGGSAGETGTGGAPPTTCGQTTAPNIEGPFFKVDSPERANLREANTTGTLLTISGTVYDESCQPVAGALLDFWQADENGGYDTLTYVYRGHQYTDSEGRYSLETIVPGRYLNGATYRPAHVHVKAAGQGTLTLTTQLYFEGDPYNEGDPFIVPSLIMALEETAPGSLVASFDFVLPSA